MHQIEEKRPGHLYVIREGMPTQPRDLEKFVSSYARFLREESSVASQIPVPLDSIFNHFSVEIGELHLADSQQGLKVSGRALPHQDQAVFVKEDDKRERRRFSLAHELMELLFEALRDGVLSTRMEEATTKFRKEKLCNAGAAELLMPEEAYIDRLEDRLEGRAPDIDMASDLAETFDVSLLSSLIRLVDLSDENLLLIAWKERLKSSQKHGQNQLTMDIDGPIGAPKRPRVEWWHWPDQPSEYYIPRGKSAPEGSYVHDAYEKGRRVSGSSPLALGNSFRGIFDIDALPIEIGKNRWIVSLLRARSLGLV